MLGDIDTNYFPADFVGPQGQGRVTGFVSANESYDWKERPSTLAAWNLILDILYTCPRHCDTL